jgi:queuine tRNA-ribosyltransferase
VPGGILGKIPVTKTIGGKIMFRLLKQEGRAKRGEFTTVHGIIQTPVFMNVGTVAAIKGAVSTEDLERIHTQVELSNTYHLHVRPGDKIIKQLGGLHKFMSWDRPILTDSGGFQVFSLAGLRRIKEEGVYFHSHIDGRKIFMGPEESMQIQSNLASTIAMAFDECPPSLAERSYVQASVARTSRWLERCKKEMDRLNSLEDTINKKQLLFGINQGAVYADIRIEHAKQIAGLGLDGYAIGGLAVGESHEEMYHIIEETVPFLPEDKPVYLMGVGTPANILEGVERGIDFFDCVYPSRNGRHGHLYTNHGKINLFNAKYEMDDRPIEEGCGCPACRRHSRAYIRHLLKAKEMLGMRLCVLHNLYFYNTMMEEIRDALDAGEFAAYKQRKLAGMISSR